MYQLLIVEDEKLIRKGIIKSIDWDSIGFEIIGEVSNGKEALKLIEDGKKPHVILTDIKMPVMDGLTLCLLLKQKYRDIEFVILSGYADYENAKQVIDCDIFAYLLKPTDEQKFIDTFHDLKQKLDKKYLLRVISKTNSQ